MGGIMSPRVSTLLIMAVVLTVSLSVLAENTLTATEAKAHIGEQATVCGKVVSTRYAEGSHGQPTFLNFDQPYPKQVFTLLIWGDDRSKFDDPEKSYRGKRICVAGKITDYKGVPEIVTNDPSQVKIQKIQ
jgi:DNA/RNA endonuclease YhcR with UshA esterase domain